MKVYEIIAEGESSSIFKRGWEWLSRRGLSRAEIDHWIQEKSSEYAESLIKSDRYGTENLDVKTFIDQQVRKDSGGTVGFDDINPDLKSNKVLKQIQKNAEEKVEATIGKKPSTSNLSKGTWATTKTVVSKGIDWIGNVLLLRQLAEPFVIYQQEMDWAEKQRNTGRIPNDRVYIKLDGTRWEQGDDVNEWFDEYNVQMMRNCLAKETELIAVWVTKFGSTKVMEGLGLMPWFLAGPIFKAVGKVESSAVGKGIEIWVMDYINKDPSAAGLYATLIASKVFPSDWIAKLNQYTGNASTKLISILAQGTDKITQSIVSGISNIPLPQAITNAAPGAGGQAAGGTPQQPATPPTGYEHPDVKGWGYDHRDTSTWLKKGNYVINPGINPDTGAPDPKFAGKSEYPSPTDSRFGFSQDPLK